MDIGWLKKFFARFYSDEPPMLMPAVKEQPEEDDVHDLERKLAAKVAHAPSGDDNGGDDGGGDDGGGDFLGPPGH